MKLESSPSGEAFRERIVQASIELIDENGLSALSMREVARRAGVSHQAPYHHFADREAILGAIAEQGFRLLSERIERATAEVGGAAHEGILAAGRAYLAFALEHGAHFRVMFRPELVTIEKYPGVQQEGDRACSAVLETVRAAVQRGLPPEPSVDALFLLCWSVVHGLACLALDGPLDIVMPASDRKAQTESMFAAFSHLLEARIAASVRSPTSEAL